VGLPSQDRGGGRASAKCRPIEGDCRRFEGRAGGSAGRGKEWAEKGQGMAQNGWAREQNGRALGTKREQNDALRPRLGRASAP